MGRHHGPPVVGGHHRAAGALLRPGNRQSQFLGHRRAARRRGPERGGRAGRGQPRGPGRARPHTGTMDLRVPIEQDRPENRANDVKIDSRGRAWVGTMAYDKRPRNAALYRVDGGQAACVVGGLTICNGPAFDEPQERLYLADTALFVVDVFGLDPATGILTGRRRFLDFGDAQVWPDGMTVDDEGMLWVALGRGRGHPPLPRRRHPRRRDRAARHQPHLGGLRRHRRRRPVHHDLMVRLRTRQPRRPASGRRDLPLPPRGNRAPLTAVRGCPGHQSRCRSATSTRIGPRR